MAKEIKRKSSFGTVSIDHFSPKLPPDTPKGINIIVSFEEALKLHLGLMQILGKLNGYNRQTTEGKATAVDLCIFTDAQRMTITEDKIAKEPAKKSK